MPLMGLTINLESNNNNLNNKNHNYDHHIINKS